MEATAAAERTTRVRPSPADWSMLVLVLVWGANFTVIKLALRSFAPMSFGALRLVLAALVTLALLALRRERLQIARPDLLPVLMLGLVGHGLYQVTFVNALARTTPANSSLLLAAMPVLVAGGGYLFRTERAPLPVWAGILLSFAGILLLILGDGNAVAIGSGTLAGDLLMLVTAGCWAVYTTAGRRYLARYSPAQLNAATLLIGTVPALIVALPDLLREDWGSLPAAAWGGLLFSGAISMGLLYLVWVHGMKRLGSACTAVYQNLVPAVAIAIAWATLGDVPTGPQIGGAVLVLGGIALTRRGREGPPR